MFKVHTLALCYVWMNADELKESDGVGLADHDDE
jgi:hypothetical protein